MTRSVAIISLITSLFLFAIKVPRAAILPLLVSMYLIFTDGAIRTEKTSRQFSKYHILFALRCSINIGLAMLLYTFGVSLLYILCSLIGFHMIIIWVTLIGKYQDEYTMFHVGFYFMMCIVLRYIPMEYGLRAGTIAWLLFPVVTFLLYAGGSFFIHPFIPLGPKRHYRTVLFFIISFLCSIILYFFSMPVIGWSAALILYTGLIWFVVRQYVTFVILEKNKKVGAEDILAGYRVIQPEESSRYSTQAWLYRVVQHIPHQWRLMLVCLSMFFLLGVFVNSFFPGGILTPGLTFVVLCASTLIYYFNISQRHKINYPTQIADGLLGLFVHGIFIWTLWQYARDSWMTLVFLTMGWVILHQGLSVFLASESKYRSGKRKVPLLYGYALGTALVAVAVMLFITKLGLNTMFTRGLILVLFGIIGTMLYFFVRAMTPKTQTRERKFEV